MQTRRVVSVCMTDFDHHKLMPFELDYISSEFLGDHQTFRDLAGIARVPETRNVLWRGLPPQIRESPIHGDSADETHSAWSVDLTGVSGRTCKLASACLAIGL